jgi:hypothetical protein
MLALSVDIKSSSSSVSSDKQISKLSELSFLYFFERFRFNSHQQASISSSGCGEEIYLLYIVESYAFNGIFAVGNEYPWSV